MHITTAVKQLIEATPIRCYVRSKRFFLGKNRKFGFVSNVHHNYGRQTEFN